jgi:hypothetical protein
MTLRNWYENPGQDGMFWNLPFQTTATWTTGGAVINTLRQGSGHVHLPGDFSTPYYIGQASDPLVQVTDGTKTIHVHIPVGAVTEMPVTGTDNVICGADVTQPYMVWTANVAQINTGSIQASGSSITCGNIAIEDGAGQFMMDAVTGQPGTGNGFGAIGDLELTLANADPNYVIQHMLAYEMDASQMNSAAAIWPLNIIDTSFPNTGGMNQGYTIGIPASTTRPTGMSRGEALLWDVFQQFGAFFYNVSGNGTLSFSCYPVQSANQALANDIASSIGMILPHMCILSNQSGLSSMKGMVGGVRSDAFPAPPLLDLSPTGGVEVVPSSFGAWYPSGYNVTPTAPTPPLALPGVPVSLSAGTPTASQVVLSWNVPTSGGAVANYEVFQSTAGGNFVHIGTPTTTTFTVTGLSPSTAYAFEVEAQNATGNSSASTAVSVTTPPTVATIQAQVVQLENIESQLSALLASISTNVGLL